jgi:hypothetical protein
MYHFNVMPKITGNDGAENPQRASVTSKLMNVMFGTPEYRILALKMYSDLRIKIANNPVTRVALDNIATVMKGGTAYTYVVRGCEDMFPFSDLDIVIYINPNMPPKRYEVLKNALNTIVLQTMSQYKRTLDHMLFLGKPIDSTFMDNAVIRHFKEDFENALGDLDCEEGIFVSPFVDTATRNGVSRNSFIIADSLVKDDSVVRVEVPHFEMCEHIPLRKTPIFCSHNRSINFKRVPGSDDVIGCFDLYRMRFNTMFLKNDRDTTKREYNVVTADFIDISILDQSDAENADFWRHGAMAHVFDRFAGVWIDIPDVDSMIYDLHKMLNVYECPESKREKRHARLHALKALKRRGAASAFPRTSFGRAGGYNCV